MISTIPADQVLPFREAVKRWLEGHVVHVLRQFPQDPHGFDVARHNDEYIWRIFKAEFPWLKNFQELATLLAWISKTVLELEFGIVSFPIVNSMGTEIEFRQMPVVYATADDLGYVLQE